MCTVLLPPGGNPIEVKYIISHHIVYITGNDQESGLSASLLPS